MKIAFIFRYPPFGTSKSREGLEALLAMTAFAEPSDISVFFLHDGILNLLPEQTPTEILHKDFSASFKLLDLCEIEQCYLCIEHNLQGLNLDKLVIKTQPLDYASCQKLIQSAEKILTF